MRTGCMGCVCADRRTCRQVGRVERLCAGLTDLARTWQGFDHPVHLEQSIYCRRCVCGLVAEAVGANSIAAAMAAAGVRSRFPGWGPRLVHLAL